MRGFIKEQGLKTSPMTNIVWLNVESKAISQPGIAYDAKTTQTSDGSRNAPKRGDKPVNSLICQTDVSWHQLTFSKICLSAHQIIAFCPDPPLWGCIECMRCRLLLPMSAVSVCLSVTRLISASLCKNVWTDQDAFWGEHSCGLTEHCVKRESWSPTERERGPTFKL